MVNNSTDTNSTDLLKKVILYGSIAAIFTALVFFTLFNYALVYISVNNPDNIPGLQVFTSYDGEMKNIGKPGLKIIKREADGIAIQANQNIRTLSPFDTPWYGLGYKKLSVQYDKNADKIAYNSTLDEACGVYSTKYKRLAQYGCVDDPRMLMYYNAPTDGEWKLETIANLSYPESQPSPYMGGLIGIGADRQFDVGMLRKNRLIHTVSSDGRLLQLDQPPEIGCIFSVCTKDSYDIITKKFSDNRIPARIFTDTKNSTNNRFIFVTSDGEIYLGTPQSKESSAVSYKKIDKSADYDTYNSQVLCDISGAYAVCYIGQRSKPYGQVSSKPTKSYIIEMSFDSDEKQEIPLDDNFVLENFGVTADKKLFGNNKENFLYLQKNKRGTKVTPVSLSDNSVSFATADKAYLLQDDGLFAVDTDSLEMHQVFYSDNIKPERIVAADSKVFIIGKSKLNTGSSYAWRINNQKDTNYGKRAIDNLPSIPRSAAYGTTDLVENRLYLTLPLTSTSTREDAERLQASTLEYLKLSGIDVDKFTIVDPYNM